MARGLDSEVRVQAAVWLARLRSEARTVADEAGLKAWLGEKPAHREAFEAVSAVFEAAGVVGADFDRSGADIEREPRISLGRRAAVASAALACLIAVGWGWWHSNEGLVRGEIGQPRNLVLQDGSQVALDTNSSIRVEESDSRRLVHLLAGRARFQVARDPARPFIVLAGDQQVIALGTVFTVTAEADQTSIVLENGQVMVRSDLQGARAVTTGDERVLTPGDRLVFRSHAVTPEQDRPDLARLDAWRRGRAVFEDVPLEYAVREINRYNRRTIELTDSAAAALHLSGTYRTDDPDAFAHSLAELLPVEVRSAGDRIVISSRRSGP
ncbi:MAG: FecR domain-containing protein [Proteobacteria bacterium]|nr:FecR domain-containing protein [Pseudomonadota bacterium]